MANIFDYIQWRDLSIEKVEFNEIDNLILARLSYFPLDGVVNGEEEISITEAYEKYEKLENKGRILQQEDTTLFPILAKSTRFGKMKLTNYINKIDPKQEKQFSAVTILMPDNTIYVAYRGTDNTIVGWKEDFNMSFKSHIASQLDSVKYVNNIAEKYKNKIRIGGHSKGGNLAVYSAVHGGKAGQKRLLKVYSMDGPGFHEDFLELEAYQNIAEKVLWYMPYESIIGTVLMHGCNEFIVKSSAKGIMQHNPLSWMICQNRFVKEKHLSKEAVLAHLAITECLEQLTVEQRKQFVGIIFDALDATEAKKLADIRLKNLLGLIDSVKKLDPDSKNLFKETARLVLKTVKENR